MSESGDGAPPGGGLVRVSGCAVIWREGAGVLPPGGPRGLRGTAVCRSSGVLVLFCSVLVC